MEIAQIFENKPKGKIYSIIGNVTINTNNINYSIITGYTFNNTVKSFLNSDKDIKALKMVMLNELYLDKTVNELSDMEIKKIVLAKALIENKDYIVLDYFEKGLSSKEKDNFKRFFKKLSSEYQKTIIISTNDITFIWDISDEIISVDNSSVTNIINKDDYLKQSIIDKPQIIKFIDLVKEKGADIDYYKNVQDLLKAIYRIKGD